MEQKTLVGRASTFGHEEELVRLAIDCIDLDLCWEIRAGVLFGVHVERRHLAVPEVGGEIGVGDTSGDLLFVTATGEYVFSLLALDDCCAGVLAHRQHATGCDGSVLQKIKGDESVVVGGLRVIKNLSQLFEMAGA